MASKEEPKCRVCGTTESKKWVMVLDGKPPYCESCMKKTKGYKIMEKIMGEYGVTLLMLGMELDKETSDAVFKVLKYYKASLKKKIEGLRGEIRKQINHKWDGKLYAFQDNTMEYIEVLTLEDLKEIIDE